MVEYIPQKIAENNKFSGDSFNGRVLQFDPTVCDICPVNVKIPISGNIFINGVPRFGKTYLTKCFYKILEKDESQSVIFEVRRDYLDCFCQNGDKVISFSDIDGCDNFHWNIIEEIRCSSDVEKEIVALADHLITLHESGVQNDSFWIDSARMIFKACLRAILDKAGDSYISNKYVFDFIETAGVEQLRKFILQNPKLAHISETVLSEEDAKMVNSILSFLKLPISKIGGNFRSADGKDTIRSFLNGDYKRLFIVFDNEYASGQADIIAFFLRKIIDHKTGRPDKRHHMLMLLDEIAILGRDFGLLEASTLGLGSGQLQIVLVTQSVGKLYNITQQNNAAPNVSALISGFATQVCFNSSDEESQRHLTTPFGDAKITVEYADGIDSITVRTESVPFYSLASKLGVGEFIYKTLGFPTQIVSVYNE